MVKRSSGRLRQQPKKVVRTKPSRVNALVSVAHDIRPEFSLEQNATVIAQQMCATLQVEACVIRAVIKEEMVLLGSWGVPSEVLHKSLSTRYGIAQQIIAEQRPLIVDDTATHPATAPYIVKDTWGFKFLSYMGVPLIADSQVIGVVGVYTTTHHRLFSTRDIAQVQQVSHYLSVLLATELRYQAAREASEALSLKLEVAESRARQDPLTHLWNTECFHNQLAIYLGQENPQSVTHGALFLMDVDNFKFFNEAFGYLTGDAVLKRVAHILRQTAPTGATVARLGGDEFALIIPGMTPSEVPAFRKQIQTAAQSLTIQPEGYAVEIPFRLSIGQVTFPQEGRTLEQIMKKADQRLRMDKVTPVPANLQQRVRQTATPGLHLLLGLVEAAETQDRFTRQHCLQVAALVEKMAPIVGFTPEEAEQVSRAALIHDVGNIGVPARLLRYPSRLTTEEILVVQQHVVLGALLVAATDQADLSTMIRHHHENWDGTGYPDKLQAEAIPPAARLIRIASAFTALRTIRPFRHAFTTAEAFVQIEAEAGKKFDPAMVRVLKEVVQSGQWKHS